MAEDTILHIFKDGEFIKKVQIRLPYLFQLAEDECSRAGKLGMQIGSIREQIIIALLIHKFGLDNINTDIPITAPEVDVEVFKRPISIKTKTGAGVSGVKIIWTVDRTTVLNFLQHYSPSCDTIFIQLIWNGNGGLYYIPLETQIRWIGQLGREGYIKLPPEGTNPRGVEFTRNALSRMINDSSTQKIDIFWRRTDTQSNIYKRWLDLWEAESL